MASTLDSTNPSTTNAPVSSTPSVKPSFKSTPTGTPMGGSSKKRKRDMVGVQPVKLAKNPFNMTARNFPKQRKHMNKSSSSFLMRKNKAKNTSPREALETVRAALQPTLNVEIEKVLQSYQEMFRMAAYNIGDNLKEQVTEDHVSYVLRSSLEEAKKMFKLETNENAGEDNGNTAMDSSAIEKAWTPARNVIIKKNKMQLRREVRSNNETKVKDTFDYPLWNESRLTNNVEIIMGFKAQKILGFASARGRLYIRHPQLFKYQADQDDKQWLADQGHVPCNAGKSYLMLAEDIRLLAIRHPDYKDNLGMKEEDIKGFTVPEFILKKVKLCMKKQAIIQRVRKSIDSP